MEDKKSIGLLTEILGLVKVIAEGIAVKPINTRFTDNGDGTISDKKTGLMWQKEGSSDSMNHSDAEKYCKDSEIGDHSDWRLPTVEELLTLIDYKKNDPAIDPVFKAKSAYYWTSTPYAGGSGYAWVVGFFNGYTNWYLRDGDDDVRPVRQYLN